MMKSILATGIRKKDIFPLLNGCTDKTEDEVRKYGIHPVIMPCKGKAKTLTCAVHELKLFDGYTHVSFSDADSLFDKSYFKVVRKRLRSDPTIDIVCGRPKSLPCNWLTAHRAAQYWGSQKIHKSAQQKIGALFIVPGCAGTYSLESLKKIIFTSDCVVEDIDASAQARQLGCKIFFEPKAIVYTQDPSTISDYTRQLYGRWFKSMWMVLGKYGILWKGWKSPFNWDCRLMLMEILLWMAIPIIFWTFGSKAIVYTCLMYISFFVAQGIACACADRRPDILKYLLFLPLLQMYDFVLLVATIPNILKRSDNDGWQHPKRY